MLSFVSFGKNDLPKPRCFGSCTGKMGPDVEGDANAYGIESHFQVGLGKEFALSYFGRQACRSAT